MKTLHTCPVTTVVYFNVATDTDKENHAISSPEVSFLFLSSSGELLGLQLSQHLLKAEMNYSHGLRFCPSLPNV